MLSEDIKVVQLFAAGAKTVTDTSVVIDREEFDAAVAVLDSAAASSGDTLDVKLQSSDPDEIGTKDGRALTADNDFELRSNTATHIKISCMFTQSGARQIRKVYLYLKKKGTITSGKKVTVTLETDSTGSPSGTAVQAHATADVLCSAISTSYGWVEFAFTKPVTVANSTVYHIVLTGDYDVSGTNNVMIGTDTVASGGDFDYYDAAWTGTSSTIKVLAQTWQYNFADISSAAFTQVTSAAVSYQTKDVSLIGSKRYVRALATVAGNGSESINCAAALVLGDCKVKPVTA